jgi:hypothetical protein
VRLVAQGYPADVVDRGTAGLVEERAAVLAALEREGAGRGSLEVLRALRGLDVAALIADAREAPASRQVALLRGMYAEVRVWRDRVEFVPVVGEALVRALPGYWGKERGGAWGW